MNFLVDHILPRITFSVFFFFFCVCVCVCVCAVFFFLFFLFVFFFFFFLQFKSTHVTAIPANMAPLVKMMLTTFPSTTVSAETGLLE